MRDVSPRGLILSSLSALMSGLSLSSVPDGWFILLSSAQLSLALHAKFTFTYEIPSCEPRSAAPACGDFLPSQLLPSKAFALPLRTCHLKSEERTSLAELTLIMPWGWKFLGRQTLPEPEERHARAVGWWELMASVEGAGGRQNREWPGELSTSPHDPSLGLTQIWDHILSLLFTTSR